MSASRLLRSRSLRAQKAATLTLSIPSAFRHRPPAPPHIPTPQAEARSLPAEKTPASPRPASRPEPCSKGRAASAVRPSSLSPPGHPPALHRNASNTRAINPLLNIIQPLLCEQSAHNPDYVKYLRINKFTDYPFNPVGRGGVRRESRCVGHRPPGRLRDSGARLTGRPSHPASTSSRTTASHSAHGLTPVAGPLSSTAAGRSRLPVLLSGKPSRKTVRLRFMAFLIQGDLRPP